MWRLFAMSMNTALCSTSDSFREGELDFIDVANEAAAWLE